MDQRTGESLKHWFETGVSESFHTIAETFGEFGLLAGSCLLLLTATWIVAKLAQAAVGLGLRVTGFDRVADLIGLGKLLRRVGIDNLPSYVAGNLCYWLILLFGGLLSIAQTRVVPVTLYINGLLSFLPPLMAILLVVVVTAYLAHALRLAVSGVMAALGVGHPLAYGRTAWTLIWLTGIGVLADALGAPEPLQTLALQALIAAAAAGLAAAATAAGWTLGRELIFGWSVRRRLRVGEQVYLDEGLATVKAFHLFTIEANSESGVLITPYSRAGADTLRKKVL